jgi:hypothetical protein
MTLQEIYAIIWKEGVNSPSLPRGWLLPQNLKPAQINEHFPVDALVMVMADSYGERDFVYPNLRKRSWWFGRVEAATSDRNVRVRSTFSGAVRSVPYNKIRIY